MSDLLQTLSMILALSLIMGVPFANHEIAPSPHHPPPPLPSHFICRLRCSDFTVAYLLGQANAQSQQQRRAVTPSCPMWNKTSFLLFFLLHPSFQKASPYSTPYSRRLSIALLLAGPVLKHRLPWPTDDALWRRVPPKHFKSRLFLGGSLKAQVWAFLMWENGAVSMQTAPTRAF